MKLSEINVPYFTDEQIQKIVYSDIQDTSESAEYGIVFGNSMLFHERVNKAFEIYKSGRVKKLIFTGGANGVSNQDGDNVSEAVKMKNKALELGIKESDILIEIESNNTFENVDNVFNLLPKEIKTILIVTSEFHLKRCMAIIKKKFPNVKTVLIAVKDGFSDSNNWFLSDNSWNSGRSLATYEAGLLVKYAKNNQIADLDISDLIEKS